MASKEEVGYLQIPTEAGEAAPSTNMPKIPSTTAAARENFKKRSESSLIKACPFSEGALTIRELRREDVKAVKEICFNHFRSTGLAAARYYIVAHIQDMALLAGLAFVFMSLPGFIISVLLFHVYLFAKSRWELEQYIRHDCDDLRTAYETYMENGPQSRFWVAELALNCYGTCSANDQCSHKVIAGCVGLVPSKETANVGKLVRLIVDSQHRRMKIGSRLLMQVEQHASDLGFTDMRIYTNSLNPTHVKFVRQHGYTIAQTVRRGLMRGDLMTWHKHIAASTISPQAISHEPQAMLAEALAAAEKRDSEPSSADHKTEDSVYKRPLLHKRDRSEFNLTITSAASHVMD